VFLRCMHPNLEGARKDIWDRPDKDGRMRKRPTSLSQLLGKSKWEKPLADWIMATGVGLVGQEMGDKEAERVERYFRRREEPFSKNRRLRIIPPSGEVETCRLSALLLFIRCVY
jgi:hypothetical protein